MKANRFNRILVPVSLAVESTTAFKQALFFRKQFGAEITLLHVVQKVGGLSNVFQPSLKNSLQGRGMVRLIRFAKTHFRGRIPEDVNLRVEVGNHVQIIKSIIDSESFNLVILNRSNRIDGLAERYNSNSVNQIIRASRCPIMSVNDRWTGSGIRNVLVPVDTSRQSRDLVNWSILLGKTFNAKIKLLAALTVNIELKRSLAYKKTQIMQHLIENEGVQCSVEVVEKESNTRSDVLIESAKKTQADLLLVQGFQDLMFSNSPSERLLSDFLQSSSRPIFSLGVKDEGFVSNLLMMNSKQVVLSDRISNKAFKW
ncbi:universal stress protein [Marinifilum fragile]|jgi:Universal stress protein family.|uniref:universal stress protein n=1 Tax=Marinifilum fragile TaxID=570161 RepID=UPI002AA6B141|nr:universal stress protein [Marinifilum fragile]